ncbi:MAG: hypothetical protein ACE5GN_00600 [Waddliaceae bacterium]
MLLIEIILTITAWNKGWRWWALMPAIIVFGISFIAGLVIGASGGTIQNIVPFLLLDVFLIISLISLISSPKKTTAGGSAGSVQIEQTS